MFRSIRLYTKFSDNITFTTVTHGGNKSQNVTNNLSKYNIKLVFKQKIEHKISYTTSKTQFINSTSCEFTDWIVHNALQFWTILDRVVEIWI